MRVLVSTLPTTWSHIRFALYRRDDGHFQFFEEILRDCGAVCEWQGNQCSGLFADPEAAELAMSAYMAEYKES